MLKLLIADDEKTIRESISTFINWNTLDIELVGTAKNGIEAYNMILDLYPDIVLTDIKMPGFTGLDLIEKIHEINKDTKFIILSGFNEFEYAKKAMQYGVRHYLLKPCREDQIIESINEVKEEYKNELLTRHIIEEHSELKERFNTSLIINAINYYLAYENDDPKFSNEFSFDDYDKYFDSNSTPYKAFYLYFLEECHFQSALKLISSFGKRYYPALHINYLYVHNTLLFFFRSFSNSTEDLENFCKSLSFENQQTCPTVEFTTFENLKQTLEKICPQIKRYEKIYYSDGNKITTISNYNNLIKDIQEGTTKLFCSNLECAEHALSLLLENITNINELTFLKQIASSIILITINHIYSFGVVNAADFLLEVENAESLENCKEILFNKLNTLYQNFHFSSSTGAISDKIKLYVTNHFSNSDLSLKWIAENELFMNVDYISKCFVKETGQKFSSYLTEIRINKAKELMSSTDGDKIQNIAELIGCGNNPQYFSQIFKKSTGMSPSNYVKMIQGSNNRTC